MIRPKSRVYLDRILLAASMQITCDFVSNDAVVILKLILKDR